MPWQYEDENGEWKPMDKQISQMLDTAKAQGQNRCAYSLETPGGKFNYSVDLTTLVQRNTKSGMIRSIRESNLFGPALVD